MANSFLQSGGLAASVVENLPKYEYREYPKAVKKSLGMRKVVEVTETIKGEVLRNEYQREEFEEIVVNDAEEEAAVLAGEATVEQREDERQRLIDRAEQLGARVDRRWSTDRIRQEMAKFA